MSKTGLGRAVDGEGRTLSRLDRHIAMRVRERRILLGLTQMDLAATLGIAYQQIYKYEAGLNRISAGNLYRLAKALDVDVDYFVLGIEEPPPAGLSSSQRLFAEVARSFRMMREDRQKEAFCAMVRLIAEIEDAPGEEMRRSA